MSELYSERANERTSELSLFSLPFSVTRSRFLSMSLATRREPLCRVLRNSACIAMLSLVFTNTHSTVGALSELSRARDWNWDLDLN